VRWQPPVGEQQQGKGDEQSQSWCPGPVAEPAHQLPAGQRARGGVQRVEGVGLSGAGQAIGDADRAEDPAERVSGSPRARLAPHSSQARPTTARGEARERLSPPTGACMPRSVSRPIGKHHPLQRLGPPPKRRKRPSRQRYGNQHRRTGRRRTGGQHPATRRQQPTRNDSKPNGREHDASIVAGPRTAVLVSHSRGHRVLFPGGWGHTGRSLPAES
jgi:hypothetical protein